MVPWKPDGLAEAKNTAVQVPGDGYRTSIVPWLPAPCGREWSSYSPFGPMTASRIEDCPLLPPPGQVSSPDRWSAPTGTVNLVVTNALATGPAELDMPSR